MSPHATLPPHVPSHTISFKMKPPSQTLNLIPHLPLNTTSPTPAFLHNKHTLPSKQAKRTQAPMGKKLGFTSLFARVRDTGFSSPSSSSSSAPSPSWHWPSCKHPKTSSFRARDGDDIFKTVNSVYFDSADSCFTNTSEDCCSESFSTVSDDSGSESLETMIKGLRSERLFFEPGGGTSSIFDEPIKSSSEIGVPFKESVAMAMESEDPYGDFRKSMEEMVVAQGMKEWGCLEELLIWYLRVNGKKNHGYILGAFVDLLVGLACSSSSSSSLGEEPSPSSSYSTSSLSFEIEEIEEEEEEGGSS